MEIKQRPPTDTKMPKYEMYPVIWQVALTPRKKAFARKRRSISPSTVMSLQHCLANDSIVRILSIIMKSACPILRFRNQTNNFQIRQCRHVLSDFRTVWQPWYEGGDQTEKQTIM